MALDPDLIDCGSIGLRFRFRIVRSFLALMFAHHANTISPPQCRRIDTLVLVAGVVSNGSYLKAVRRTPRTLTTIQARGRGRQLRCGAEPAAYQRSGGY